VAAAVFSGILTVFADQVHLKPVALMTCFALGSLLGLGVGLVNCSLFALSRTWQQVYGVIARPLFLISGVFFTFESLPRAVREVLWWNPLIHLVGLMRSGFYPTYDDAHVSVLYPLAVGLGLTALGLALMLACASRLQEG